MEPDTKPCPVCGEAIKAVALKCRFCNTDLSAYAAAKEAEVERDLFVGHPAVLYSVGQLIPFLVVFAAALIALVKGVEFRIVFPAFLLLSGFIWLRLYLASRSKYWKITSQRIKTEDGLLGKTQDSLELFRIDHFRVIKPSGERPFGYCRLHVFNSDREESEPDAEIYAVPSLEALADTLRECQLKERGRRGLTTFLKA
jgi:uncharacterized membrane protein YdbT with pleckstrin-like domain